jgi:hypothetical protein
VLFFILLNLKKLRESERTGALHAGPSNHFVNATAVDAESVDGGNPGNQPHQDEDDQVKMV